MRVFGMAAVPKTHLVNLKTLFGTRYGCFYHLADHAIEIREYGATLKAKKKTDPPCGGSVQIPDKFQKISDTLLFSTA